MGKLGGGTIAHELVHALIANDFTEAPEWLNEGLASLYEEAENGKPKNNYRLILFNRHFENYNACIKWTDLIDLWKVSGASDVNYNLLCAYSRYFCKFIYDRYGKQQLIKLYKQLRSAFWPASQRTGCYYYEPYRKKQNRFLQKEWQEYFMAESVPANGTKWPMRLTPAWAATTALCLALRALKQIKPPQAADNNNSAGGEQIQQEQRELMPPNEYLSKQRTKQYAANTISPVQKLRGRSDVNNAAPNESEKRQHPEMQQ